MDALIILGFFFGIQPLVFYVLANYSIEINKIEDEKEEWK